MLGHADPQVLTIPPAVSRSVDTWDCSLAREEKPSPIVVVSAEKADPGAAFFDFLTRLGAEGVAKRDTSDAIAVPGPLRDELHDALAVLLQRAQHAGAVRADITAADLVALFKGLLDVVHEDGDPGRAGRVLAIVIDGLRPPSR